MVGGALMIIFLGNVTDNHGDQNFILVEIKTPKAFQCMWSAFENSPGEKCTCRSLHYPKCPTIPLAAPR